MDTVKMRRNGLTRKVDSKNVKLFQMHGFEVVSEQPTQVVKRINPPIALKPIVPEEVKAMIASIDVNAPEPVKEVVVKKKAAPRKRKPIIKK